jgi:general secretion pathway protein E
MITGTLTPVRELPDPRSKDFVDRLGEFLLQRGFLDRPAVNRAKSAQAMTNERFDLVLTRLGLLPEAKIANILAEVLSIAFVERNGLPDRLILDGAVRPQFLKDNKIWPIEFKDDTLVVAVADPFNIDAIQSLSYLINRPVEERIAAPSDIDLALERLPSEAEPHRPDELPAIESPPSTLAADDDVRRLQDMASEAPVIRLVHDLIARAVEALASDIHIEPREDSLRVRFRIDGMLHTIETLPPALRPAVTSRIKIMARLNIAERRLPQDGRIRTTVRGKDIDLRISTMPTLYGESVVMRILDRSESQRDFAALGFNPIVADQLKKTLSEPNGIVLVTGPTGSGKTTTLYTALGSLNSTAQKIFTVEDPIEYEIAGVNQIQIQPQIGLTFASALRSILRQDPDIIMIGEIRDLETAEIAIQASLTGHLVLSTIHTNSAAATLTRLIEMGVADYLLASSLTGVLAQRLVRRLCSCATPAQTPQALVEKLWYGDQTGPRDNKFIAEATSGLRQPAGCEACRNTGYRGRSSVGEMLVMTNRLRELLVSRASENVIAQEAVAAGMKTLFHDGLMKAFQGETTIDEVLRVTRIS